MLDLNIRRANELDADAILAITKEAFLRYRNELADGIPVKALSETKDDVLKDILTQNVLIAEKGGKPVGSIRYCELSDELMYVYRFGVLSDEGSNGVGSELLGCVIDDCTRRGYKAIALHTNSRYYKLARYYYGKQFFVHSTTSDRGYIRALFIKELNGDCYDVSPAFKK